LVQELSEMHGFLFAYIGTSKSSRKDIAHTVARDLGLQKIVKYSSRTPRIGEVEGLDQHFISQDELVRLTQIGIITDIIKNDRGECFGISRKEVDAAIADGRSAYVTIPDPAPDLVKVYGDRLVRIFTYTGRETYRKRLLRDGESTCVIETKLALYDRKFAFSSECEHVVRNDQTLETILQVKEIVSSYLGAT
jgi:guanylate kinase